MSRLADRLGVAKAVLYNHVSTREELVTLAAARAAGLHPFPEDHGQAWEDYALDHARALFELLVGDAQLLMSYMTGGLGQLPNADRTEAWLRKLLRPAFPACRTSLGRQIRAAGGRTGSGRADIGAAAHMRRRAHLPQLPLGG